MELVKINNVTVGEKPGTKKILLTVSGSVESVNEAAQGLLNGKKYDVTIKRQPKHRSLSANAYAWELIGKLAEKLRIPKEEVYRQTVMDYGVYQMIRVWENRRIEFEQMWAAKGLGWITQVLETRPDGYTNLCCYPGTSVYTVEEMARFIDCLVSDCKAQEIETLPPEQLAGMIQEDSGRRIEHE